MGIMLQYVTGDKMYFKYLHMCTIFITLLSLPESPLHPLFTILHLYSMLSTKNLVATRDASIPILVHYHAHLLVLVKNALILIQRSTYIRSQSSVLCQFCSLCI